MYGMIHRALLEMLDAEVGPDSNPLRAERQRQPELFLSASENDDDVTLSFVGAAAGALGVSVEELLVRFGEAWIAFADRSQYQRLMQASGDDIAGFISNLDRLHAGVREALPSARTPRFRVIQATGSTLMVGYSSTRAGLDPFVRGLLQGLLRRFGHEGSVIDAQSPHNDETYFLVRFQEPAT